MNAQKSKKSAPKKAKPNYPELRAGAGKLVLDAKALLVKAQELYPGETGKVRIGDQLLNMDTLFNWLKDNS